MGKGVLIALALLCGGTAAAAPGPKAPPPEIAITVDDLPAHSVLPPGETRMAIARRFIAAFKAAHVRHVIGFVNGVSAEREPASAPGLKLWRDGGMLLGNHGWSHANLDQITDAQFVDELRRNEPLLRPLMTGKGWHWFRYPFLAEGATPERRARVRKLLADHGYKVAPVTMDFSDWAYNEAYARCVGKGDHATIAALEKDYLAGAEAAIEKSRAMAHTLYKRDIPYVLLMHEGALDSHLLPQLLALYRRHGFRFVTLDRATRDPFYAADRDPALPPEPQGLEGHLIAKGLPVPAGRPPMAMDTLCR